MKDKILGEKYELSIAPANDEIMEELNRTYRKKIGTTNVLSFPFSDTEGEIFINIPLAGKESEKSGIPTKQYKDHLFIHSLLHLKGYDHGEKMEKEEDKILEKIYGKKYYNGN